MLSFNGGFVDTAGFLGLQGLFTAHVTGNFVTLGASLVLGTGGALTKLLALPVFIITVALARLAGNQLTDRGKAALPKLLFAKVILLFLFFLLAVTLGPFAHGDAPGAMLTGLVGVSAMAIQNAAQRVHLGTEPPSTLMTGTTTQIAIDGMDLLTGRQTMATEKARARFRLLLRTLAGFAIGSLTAAGAYHLAGLWCLLIAVLVALYVALIRANDPPPAPETKPA
ncbi:uncharacterized membrane protein YoaK (UPF0700 family) [Kaistia dalseonensis]|uniref:Uncharacterized membrane protein YoaK (UPF0700 family) n=1 Tax=Kaistia dalseonensis TaxID=410840 RepID=A0ABU0HCQ5_9HYPH|nr:YoaK family protein [Kaistia dalseonensis]MDQ0440055.1 uncharacterized membrane protein YoaK (UPF0700 family) [Kaistia dalseonensis]